MTDNNPFGDGPVEAEKRVFQIRREMVYRVWTITDIVLDSYGQAHSEALDDDANVSIEDAAFEYELSYDEEQVYTEIFEQAIANDGPDGAYIVVQLLDPDGNVVKQGTVDGLSDAAQVQPQYLVDGMEIESPE